MIMKSPRPRVLHTVGTPFIHFSSYTREEALQIISRDPPAIFRDGASCLSQSDSGDMMADREWLWLRYCAAIWDSLGKGAARDIVNLRHVAEKLWTPFIEPVQNGVFGPRDFSKLMVAKRDLFRGESALVHKVVEEESNQDSMASRGGKCCETFHV